MKKCGIVLLALSLFGCVSTASKHSKDVSTKIVLPSVPSDQVVVGMLCVKEDLSQIPSPEIIRKLKAGDLNGSATFTMAMPYAPGVERRDWKTSKEVSTVTETIQDGKKSATPAYADIPVGISYTILTDSQGLNISFDGRVPTWTQIQAIKGYYSSEFWSLKWSAGPLSSNLNDWQLAYTTPNAAGIGTDIVVVHIP